MTPPTGSSWRCQWLANRCQALLSIGVSLACLTCQAEGRSSLLQTGADCTPAADWERAPLQESLLANLRFSCLLTGGARADEKLPWIVALHGVGSSAKEMARNLHRLEGRARVYALEGSLPFLDGGRDWFGAPPWGNPTLFSAGVADSADRVVRFIHERRARPENAGLPVLTGYSQGGILSLVLSTRHASQFRAVASIAGLLTSDLLPEAASRAPSLPIIAFHGARDAVLPLVDARRTYQRLAEIGFAVDLRVDSDAEHKMSPGMRQAWHDTLSALVSGSGGSSGSAK